MKGTAEVGDVGLDIGSGSVLVPQSGPPQAGRAQQAAAAAPSPASLWFLPTTVNMTLPGYGDVQAGVRLVQVGQLSRATIGPGGAVDGLAGSFGLHIRKVTSAAGTEVPFGCVNVVLVSLNGQLRLTDATLTSVAGGSGRFPLGGCQGAGEAVVEHLAGTTVKLDLHIDY